MGERLRRDPRRGSGVSGRGAPSNELEHRVPSECKRRRDPAALVERIRRRSSHQAKEVEDLGALLEQDRAGKVVLGGQGSNSVGLAGRHDRELTGRLDRGELGEEFHAEAAVRVEEDEHEAAAAPLLERPLRAVEIGQREVRARRPDRQALRRDLLPIRDRVELAEALLERLDLEQQPAAVEQQAVDEQTEAEGERPPECEYDDESDLDLSFGA